MHVFMRTSVSIPLGRFQGSLLKYFLIGREAVSIPLRKVSRASLAISSTPFPFVSIPLRKVSRSALNVGGGFETQSFHSTKEGFKDGLVLLTVDDLSSFHSTKEGFKAGASGVVV